MNNPKMKAAIVEKYGSPEVLKVINVDIPTIKKDEILIKIYASAVNSGDVIVRSLKVNFIQKTIMKLIFGWQKPRNPVLGSVYSGRVDQVGNDVRDFKIGDEVFGLRGFKFGAHAEYIKVKTKSIISLKPINASFEESAAILFGGQTAHYFLHKSKITQTPGRKILIYGATSSVGTSAIQIARNYGAEVTAVCSDYNENLVLKLGAHKVIFYNKGDFTTTTDVYDVIFDTVGKISKKQCKHLLKDKGQFFTVASSDYAKETIVQVNYLKEKFEQGNYDACIDRTYTIDEIAEAHRYVDTGKKKGNVVLKIKS